MFRGQSPACDDAPLAICGARSADGAALWTAQGGRLCMSASAALKSA
jgi:hydroxyacyl-ACP dehydratase HTD2-like protein with hotdog domain